MFRMPRACIQDNLTFPNQDTHKGVFKTVQTHQHIGQRYGTSPQYSASGGGNVCRCVLHWGGQYGHWDKLMQVLRYCHVYATACGELNNCSSI